MDDLSIQFKNSPPGFDDVAKAIGFLCFHFAGMEGTVNRLLAQMLGSSPVARAVADAAGTSLDSRLTLTIKLASLVDIPQQWFDGLDEVITAIKANILPPRNRIIHDEWYMTATDTFGQSDIRANLKKPQAHQRKVILDPVRNAREAQNIWRLAKDCVDANTDLVTLHHDLFRTRKKELFPNTFGRYRTENPPPYRVLQGQSTPATPTQPPPP